MKYLVVGAAIVAAVLFWAARRPRYVTGTYPSETWSTANLSRLPNIRDLTYAEAVAR